MTPLDQKLYKLFSDKTLNEGCFIDKIENPLDFHSLYIVTELTTNGTFYAIRDDKNE
jgi:hypothetical protein